MPKKGFINTKQKVFVTEYLKDFNGKQAAIRAGYSEKTAKQISRHLLNEPCVQEYLQEKVDEMTAKNIASAIEVLRYFTRVMRGEETASVLAQDGNKPVLLNKPPDHKERLEASKYLAKFHQLFTEKISIDGTASIVFKGEEELKE